VYTDNGVRTSKKCGNLQINVDYGKDFDTMVLITGLSLLEKERRRVEDARVPVKVDGNSSFIFDIHIVQYYYQFARAQLSGDAVGSYESDECSVISLDT
jgi:hypothetical protein